MIFLKVLDGPFGYHMVEVSPQGHSFLTMVVAFLLVSRVNTGLARYNTARDSLGIMYKEVRELVQCAVVFSDTCLDTAAREWRHEVAYRCLILLRTSMVVIEYPESSVTPWQIQELNGVELEDIRNSLFINPKNHRWAHSERTIWEETMRVPIRIAYLIRKSVHSQTRRLSEQIQVTQENKLLANVDTFMVGFFGMKKFLTTVRCISSFSKSLVDCFRKDLYSLFVLHFFQPVPFPLIQMARTFMFLFVFTVPFAMLTDKSSHVAHCFMVFLLTYGFVGLEVVAIELDNPFGNDANDFKIR